MEWDWARIAKAVGDYVEALLLERHYEIAITIMIGIAWRWFMGRNFQRRFDEQNKINAAQNASIDALRATAGAQQTSIDALKSRLELPSPLLPQSTGTVVHGDLVDGDKHIHNSVIEDPPDERLRVMHYGTKHGDLTVRFHSVREAAQDIQDWLLANKLNASVSGPTLKAVIKRASENKRRK